MTIEKDFLGRAWSFPPAFDKERKDVVMLSGKEDIDSSLHILLSTTMGERVMQPRYGCNLKQFLFDPTNSEMTAYIKKLVEDAVLYFEPRIKPGPVELSVEDGKMEITVVYTIKATNARSNYVFPFYIEERTKK